jgi:hypothetical protein
MNMATPTVNIENRREARGLECAYRLDVAREVTVAGSAAAKQVGSNCFGSSSERRVAVIIAFFHEQRNPLPRKSLEILETLMNE